VASSQPVKVPALVVMSGLTDEAVALEAIQSGAQDYLVKGEVTADLLSRAIRYAIGRRHAEDLVQAHGIGRRWPTGPRARSSRR
jgi:DNA-binding NarL/FixJ family response regulator